MTQIDELQHRITAALDRVAQGVAAMQDRAAEAAPAPEPQVDTAEIMRLQEALDEEKLANAQLEERVRRLHETHERELAGAREAASAAPAPSVDVAELDREMQRLRQSNEMLRATNEELRAALAENVGEPHLINKAMLAELEGLRAARAVESAEMQAILASLTPLLDAAGPEPTAAHEEQV